MLNSLVEVFERQVQMTPGAPAVELFGRTLSYQELDSRADSLANLLRSSGITRDSRVGLCLSRTPDLAVGVLGILKAGGACVPLDARYPANRLAFMIEDAKASVLLTNRELAQALPVSTGRIILLDELDWTEHQSPRDRTQSDPAPDSLAYVIYTSGSTGRPKGVAMVHRALVNLVEWQRAHPSRLPNRARTLQFASISFDVSFQEIFSAWSTSGTLVLMPEELRYDPVNLWRYLALQRIHRLYLPFIALQHLAEAAAESIEIPEDLCEVITAGEQLQITPQIRAMFVRLARTTLHNHYGPSETHVVTAYSLPENVNAWMPLPPIGSPIANTRIYLLDDQFQEVKFGTPGELFIGGECLARGYLDQPELTRQRFVANPFDSSANSRLYRTGDLARALPDGNFEFLGRIDNQLKIRGHRVEPGEIETVLAQHPAVRECAVVARGESGNQQLVAYVVTGEDRPPIHRIREFLKERLADYMVPAYFLFLEKLPLTPSGKVDRRSLPEPPPGTPQATFVTPPQNALELSIAEVWMEFLKVPGVDTHTSFFDVGGTSLMAARIQQRLQRILHRDIPILTIFRYPTIARLASHLAETKAGPTASPRSLTHAARPEVGRGGVAIVGMAGRFPGANSVEELWRNLCDGKESLTTFSDEELLATGVDPELLRDPLYVRSRGVLMDVDQFDPGFFGITPKDAAVIDPQHRVFLECAWQAIEDAGCNPAAYPGSIGVFAGASLNTYLLGHVFRDRASTERFIREFQVDGYNVLVGNDKDYLASRVAYKLDLRGPAMTIQTACSTSLVAVCQAVASLLSGQCDIALAGGVSISFPQERGYLYQEGAIASADGHCRPFDAAANGTVFGAGAAVVALKRLADALADGDQIYAVIKGAAVNNDGAEKVSFSAPGVSGQAEVIAMAHRQAGIAADSIGYVEAHGTGTPLGDPIEIAALTQAFRQTTDRNQFCALGSLKANLGHLEAAAGVTGLIKAALSVRDGVIPPTLHFTTANPQCEFEKSPFHVSAELAEWRNDSGPRRAGVSSFGIGGTNAHVVIEEAPRSLSAPSGSSAQLLVVSAKTEAALEESSGLLANYLSRSADSDLADVASTLQTGRTAFPHRRIVVAATRTEALAKIASTDSGTSFSGKVAASEPQVVFMFPGQGAQHVNMGRELYQSEPRFREEVSRCAEVFEPFLGLDLRKVLYPARNDDPAREKLLETGLAQPALFTIEYALAKLWMTLGVQPSALVGHSVGEYAAAVLANVISLNDASSLICSRGRMMQSMPPGSMLSVRLSEPEVSPLLTGSLSVAAINSRKLTVVAGPADEVRLLQRQLDEKGIFHKALHTSHAFHSPMMDPIVAPFTASVRNVELRSAQLPIVSTLSGTWIQPDEWTEPDYWARQLRAPVRFADAVSTLSRQPELVLIEVGPGQTLTSLALQHPERKKEQHVLASMPPVEEAGEFESILTAMGRLWIAGVRVDFRALRTGTGRRLSLPGYPFERQRCWLDAPVPRGSSVADSDSPPTPLDPATSTSVEDLVRKQLAAMRMQLEMLGGRA